ncbi:hypothetical protein [Brevundimonas subvibrioides]|uniref:Uncharacterized protein n=1 Tax=Brevundimonas subvibrioides (strain ATCC 15264 / DSM 4735 / LMG 14903 / NBRC 16000 / CB 81) TaxID=633149 RepID=D9QFD7_BRESC|nr:hypothetical protein [Brevundimonas subvibrioides]ADL02452.1 conserved hypothetical protein [Brevundimonas subvibrioides ATCC 15264]
MSSMMTASYRSRRDHFEPSDNDPHEQRRLRGHLEQIDYTAFVSNREVIPQVLGLGTHHTEPAAFQRLAVAAATARARWIAEALKLTEGGVAITAQDAQRLAGMRAAYDELSEAYEGLRRMVERGYLPYRGTER